MATRVRASFKGRKPGRPPRIDGFSLRTAHVKVRTAYNKLYRFFKHHPDFKHLTPRSKRQVDLVRYVSDNRATILSAEFFDVPAEFVGQRKDGTKLKLDLNKYLRQQHVQDNSDLRLSALSKVAQHGRTKRGSKQKT